LVRERPSTRDGNRRGCGDNCGLRTLNTVVAADGARQAIVLEGSLKDTEGEVLAGALQVFTAQQLARGEVRGG